MFLFAYCSMIGCQEIVCLHILSPYWDIQVVKFLMWLCISLSSSYKIAERQWTLVLERSIEGNEYLLGLFCWKCAHYLLCGIWILMLTSDPFHFKISLRIYLYLISLSSSSWKYQLSNFFHGIVSVMVESSYSLSEFLVDPFIHLY